MTQELEPRKLAIDRAITMAESALRECDEYGLIYAAIDLSSAIDKLKVLRSTVEQG